MKVGYILDQVEQRLRDPVTRASPVKRPRLLEVLEAELNSIIQANNFPNLARHAAPIVRATPGRKQYDLPSDFPENFVREADSPGSGSYSCFLVDSSDNQSTLTYLTPGRFFAKHDPDEADSEPSDYTILILEDGGRSIVLGPTPSAACQVHGVYKPDYWEVQEEDSLTIVPNSLALLTAAVLRIVDPRRIELHTASYRDALRQAVMLGAQGSPTQIFPSVPQYSRHF